MTTRPIIICHCDDRYCIATSPSHLHYFAFAKIDKQKHVYVLILKVHMLYFLKCHMERLRKECVLVIKKTGVVLLSHFFFWKGVGGWVNYQCQDQGVLEGRIVWINTPIRTSYPEPRVLNSFDITIHYIYIWSLRRQILFWWCVAISIKDI